MLAPEASPRGRLPAAVPAVEGDDPVLIRRPFDAWGKKVWLLRWPERLLQSFRLGADTRHGQDPQGSGSAPVN